MCAVQLEDTCGPSREAVIADELVAAPVLSLGETEDPSGAQHRICPVAGAFDVRLEDSLARGRLDG